ncbi:hypothetical protein [Methyloferula stellata]|uniref:hypothetical protein n=1 Tax=Methyloferula stellata TaxID=876270 RepID=UPI00058CEA45|nr:hypothetical protein [Methyloferula stellata]
MRQLCGVPLIGLLASAAIPVAEALPDLDSDIVALVHTALALDGAAGACAARIEKMEWAHLTVPDAVRAELESLEERYRAASDAIVTASPKSVRGLRAILGFAKFEVCLDPERMLHIIGSLLASPALSEGAPANV